jgi:hypothetical protein
MRNATENINVYFQYGRAYCKSCFIKVAFGGNEKMLVHHVNDDFFVDGSGKSFDIWHDDTVQFESYNHQIIPWEGVKCDECGTTCIEPDESDLRKHRFIFIEEDARTDFKEYIEEWNIAVDNEISCSEDNEETPTYECTFYTYTSIDEYDLEYTIKKYYVSTYEVNVPQERW